MQYFIKKYIERCNEEFVPLGFKRKKNSFVRIKKDIVQIFTLKVYYGGYSCTVEFESLPFCCGKASGLGITSMFQISCFDKLGKLDNWEFNPNDENSINKCVEDLISAIEKHIIPFFERAITPFAIFKESFLLEPTLTKENLEDLLKTNNYEKYCKINIFTDPDRYYLALKTKNYDYASWYLEKHLSLAEKAYDETKNYVSDKNKKEREKYIDSLKDGIKMLELEKYDYFEEIIEKKEQEAIEFLRLLKLIK